jgi:hypothetical protein
MLTSACECDDYCTDFVAIDFRKASPWPLGDYTITVILDGQTRECVATKPYQPTDACDPNDVVASLAGVSHEGTPARVEVTISRDGNVLASEEFEPEYEATHGWDRSCGPPCEDAALHLDIP